jgi:hypothetical protein
MRMHGRPAKDDAPAIAGRSGDHASVVGISQRHRKSRCRGRKISPGVNEINQWNQKDHVRGRARSLRFARMQSTSPTSLARVVATIAVTTPLLVGCIVADVVRRARQVAGARAA